jgi:YVTN family beta-propeller protein
MLNHSYVLRVLLAFMGTCAGYAIAAPFAYVPNEGSGTVSVIDTETDQVVTEIAAGKKTPGPCRRSRQPLALCE